MDIKDRLEKVAGILKVGQESDLLTARENVELIERLGKDTAQAHEARQILKEITENVNGTKDGDTEVK